MATIQVVNPATGAALGEVPDSGEAVVEEAVDRARRAQPGWAARPFSERAGALRRLAARLLRDGELLTTLMAESGKPRYEAEAFELFYTCEITRYYTGRAGRRALRDELRRPFLFPNKRSRVVRHPVGVVGVIGPWNWPLLNNYADCVAPLACGNAVVLKPSERTPLTSIRIRDLWRAEGLPEDVLQVVTGGGAAGRALVARADMLFFTGSQARGREVARAAGERMIPCVLELGGKSPMIVLADADLARAARAAVWSSFAHSGQVCIRTERVLVEDAAADRFTELVQAETARLRQGKADADGGAGPEVGAMTHPPLIERAEQHIADAVAKGARVLTGGSRRSDLGGSFFQPTVLGDVRPDMLVAREESFCPLLPILRVKDAEEALRLANDNPSGLAGSVWSADPERARDLARRLVAGGVCVNETLLHYFCVESPLGGVKASGLGFRHGPEGLRQFCRVQTILEDSPVLGRLSAFISRQLGFPYRSPILRLLRRGMSLLYGRRGSG